jgi:hypothetical protein
VKLAKVSPRLRPWLFPLALLVAVLVLTALDLNGSSVSVIRPGDESGLVAGHPRATRSDEWRVRTPLVVRQAGSGWQQQVDIAAGTHDIGVVADVPVRDWATIVRPHHWGYWVFGLSRGFAFEWWINWALAAVGPYFLLYVLTRRVGLAACLGLVVAAAPSIQWWTNSFTGSVIGYACAGIAALMLAVARANRDRQWIGLVVAAAWLLACAGTVPYPAWVIPLFVGLAPLTVLVVVLERHGAASLRQRLVTVGCVGVGAAVLAGAFFWHHREALQAISGTVYPGQRRESGGGGSLTSLFGSPYYWYVNRRTEPVLVVGTNESEAAGPLMLLFPALLAYAGAVLLRVQGVLRARARALMLGGLVLLAWFALPVPFGAGRFLLLSQVPPDRVLHTLGPIGAIAFGATVALLADCHVEDRRRIACGAGVAMFAAVAVAGTYFTIQNAPLPGSRVMVVAAAVAIAVGVTLAVGSRGALLLAGLTVAVSLFANPLQRGLGPLADSTLLDAVLAETTAAPDVWWVSTSDDPADTAMLVASQAPMISGPSVYPDIEVWLRIDPDRSLEGVWNSFSHVMVDALAEGEATTMRREADILHLGLDLCGDDAAALEIGRVVLAEGQPLPSCAIATVTAPGADGPLRIVTVAP